MAARGMTLLLCSTPKASFERRDGVFAGRHVRFTPSRYARPTRKWPPREDMRRLNHRTSSPREHPGFNPTTYCNNCTTRLSAPPEPSKPAYFVVPGAIGCVPSTMTLTVAVARKPAGSTTI